MVVLLGGIPYAAALCADVLHVHTLPAMPPAALCTTLYVQRTASGLQCWYCGRITGSSGIVLYQTRDDGAQWKYRVPLEIRE